MHNNTIGWNQPPQWNSIDAAELINKPYVENSKRIILELTEGRFALEAFQTGIRLFSIEQRNYDYGLLLNQVQPEKISVKSNSQSSVIKSPHFRIEITHTPFAINFSYSDGKSILSSSSDGHFVRSHRIPPLAKTSQGWLISYALGSGDAVYGLGEKWSALNKRGQLIRSYNHDALGVNAEISYKNTPFCWSPEGWGVFVHTPSPVTHAIGHAHWSQRSYCCVIEDSYLDVFMFASRPGKTNNVGAELIQNYTELTGRAPIPPIWSGGTILSKAYYKDANEIISAAEEVRERGLPCDVITFDGRAWQDTNTRFAFEWDARRYPDPKLVVDKLKAMDFKLCIWEYPLISVEHAWFTDFADKGWLIKDKRNGEAYQYEWDQQAFGEVLTPLPNSGIVDFTHPDAYAFWRDAHKPLFDLGIDMIKADFGEQLEDDNMLAHNGESGLALHNVYAHLYNRCVFEAAELYGPSGAFLFSRAAWTGSQRYNSFWGGDPQADWEAMMANIRGGLSWGLSGGPFYATDVGGFYKDTRDDELYVRWTQAAIFSAHFRLHGIGDRAPWSYSSEACEAATKALKLRYSLHHYLQKAVRQASTTGMPVQRAMVLAFPNEKQSWAFENQFMFGDDLLVAPCFKPGGQTEVYLPSGRWNRFSHTSTNPSETLSGNRVLTFKLALDEIAVFVRDGVQIPLNDDVERTDQLNLDENGLIKVDRYWPSTH